MNTFNTRQYAIWSLRTITATGLLTSIHHIFRLGLYPVLIAAVLAIVFLPPLLMLWYVRNANRWAARVYGVVVAYIIAFFGVVDGFLDHVLKAVGLQNTTFLPGGDAEFVPTVMSLWSPQASNVFYEGTGVLTAVASLVAAYFLVKFLRASWPPRLSSSRVAHRA